MTIEVIVAGLPRTGTTSVCAAMELLGIGKIMHMNDCISDAQLMMAWQKIYAGHLEKVWTSEDWREFFENKFPGYAGGIDCPFADFAVEIAKAYPKAKVILQWRDPKEWFLSFDRLLKEASFSHWEAFCIWPLPGVFALHRLMSDRLHWWHDTYDYPAASDQIMTSYMNKIKSSIPSENLLIYNVKDGWEPLCRFLGKKVPQIDFPQLNDAKSSAEMHRNWKKQGFQIWMKWLIHISLVILFVSFIGRAYWQ